MSPGVRGNAALCRLLSLRWKNASQRSCKEKNCQFIGLQIKKKEKKVRHHTVSCENISEGKRCKKKRGGEELHVGKKPHCTSFR